MAAGIRTGATIGRSRAPLFRNAARLPLRCTRFGRKTRKPNFCKPKTSGAPGARKLWRIRPRLKTSGAGSASICLAGVRHEYSCSALVRLARRARVGYALKQSRFGAILMAPGHCARAVSGLCCFCPQSCRAPNAAVALQMPLSRCKCRCCVANPIVAARAWRHSSRNPGACGASVESNPSEFSTFHRITFL